MIPSSTSSMAPTTSAQRSPANSLSTMTEPTNLIPKAKKRPREEIDSIDGDNDHVLKKQKTQKSKKTVTVMPQREAGPADKHKAMIRHPRYNTTRKDNAQIREDNKTSVDRNNHIAAISIGGKEIPFPGDASKLPPPSITHRGPRGYSTAQNKLEYDHDEGQFHLYVEPKDLEWYLYGNGLSEHGLSRRNWAFHLDLESESFVTDGRVIYQVDPESPDQLIKKWSA